MPRWEGTISGRARGAARACGTSTCRTGGGASRLASASAGARRGSAAAPSILKTPSTRYDDALSLTAPFLLNVNECLQRIKAPLGSSTFYCHDPTNAVRCSLPFKASQGATLQQHLLSS
ncbi:unnamed protein product [Closterium sp. Naga37s-1]|nr:unnamed protein product [Closterium sp. Naga37s-1]